MDYRLIESELDFVPKERGDWDKVVLVSSLSFEYRFVFYLDADAVIYDMSADLRQAFVSTTGTVLAAQHPGPPVHLNTGVLFIKSGPGVADFFDKWLSLAPGSAPWFEQEIFNELAQTSPLVQVMDACWNSTNGIAESPEPVIKAWHGNGSIQRRIEAMREEMARWRQ